MICFILSHLTDQPSIDLFVCLSVCLSIYLSIYQASDCASSANTGARARDESVPVLTSWHAAGAWTDFFLSALAGQWCDEDEAIPDAMDLAAKQRRRGLLLASILWVGQAASPLFGNRDRSRLNQHAREEFCIGINDGVKVHPPK